MRTIAALLFCLSLSAQAPIDVKLTNARWPARWITHPQIGGAEFSVVLFRRTIDLPSKPASFNVHVSADNRYRLYVNGRYVSEGPPTDDFRHWRFETHDLGPHLKPGRNVIAALVWQGGYYRMMAQFSHRLGFLMQGDGPAEQVINTGDQWKTHLDAGWSAIEYEQVDPRFLWRYYVAGPGEAFDSARHPFGWEFDGFDDSGWLAPRLMPVASPKGVEGHMPYELLPRAVAPLKRTMRQVAKVQWPLVIPANTKRSVMLDMGELTFGWPHVAWKGGAGARFTMRYSEALRLKDKQASKGNRNELEGKVSLGPWDEVRTGGAERELMMLQQRSARFIEVSVETASEPLEIGRIEIEETTYPARKVGSLQADDPQIGRIFDAGWRTLELGAQDNFVSDLGWERIQYVGDTMVQSMAWLAATGDDKLVRLAIEQFDYSRLTEGITQSRYPANLVQLTPIYALAWVQMVCDYHLYRGDLQFLKERMPGIRAVFDWYQRTRNHDGLLGPLPGLDFIDHIYSPRYRELKAEHPTQTITVHNLFYAWTLNRTAAMAESLGYARDAADWRAEAARLNAKMRELAWDPQRKLFSDSPSKRHFSMHANLLAVLSGAAPAAERKPLLERAIADKSLVQVELYYQYILNRALREAGMADRYVSMLAPWRRMLDAGMTTFGETDVEPRSECHPWSASPNFDLLALTAGIEPAKPGFAELKIEPAPGPLKEIRASYPHPKGLIRLDLKRCGGGGIAGSAEIPQGLPATFHWSGQSFALKPGANVIKAGVCP